MNTFLYKTGNECIDITGGFISCPYTLTGTSVEVIKNSDNIQLNPNGAGRHTSLSHNTAINLTEYKSIYFDIEVVSNSGANQWTRLGLSTNNNQNDYGIGEVTIENTVGRKIYYIDLTDKTGLAFVKAHINCGTGAVSPFMNIKIYNIWLEENLEKLPVLTDLSSAIQYSENINSKISTLKIKLENSLIQKGVSCSNTDKFSSLIDKVNNISLEGLGGKKWATGTVTSSSTTIQYISSKGGTANNKHYSATINNLSFIPSVVIVYGSATGNGSYNALSVYCKHYNNYAIAVYASTEFSTINTYELPVLLNMVESEAILEDGVIMPVYGRNTTFASKTYNWIAFE